MLLLSVLGFLILFAFISMGTSFAFILFMQNQLQKLADQVSLAGACQLNDGNRLGQMNDLVARARQLVYASRQNYEASFNNNKELQQLTQQLLEEDRQSVTRLEKERIRLQALSVKEARKAMNEVFSSQKDAYGVSLPWIVVKPPALTGVTFGSVSNVDSNASAKHGIEELIAHDQTAKFVRKDLLYCGNINAKLPQEDNDLDFYLSSLAAPVQEIIAPARLILSDSFHPQTAVYLPTAVEVRVGIGLNTPLMKGQGTDLSVTSYATTSGASPSH